MPCSDREASSETVLVDVVAGRLELDVVEVGERLPGVGGAAVEERSMSIRRSLKGRTLE